MKRESQRIQVCEHNLSPVLLFSLEVCFMRMWSSPVLILNYVLGQDWFCSSKKIGSGFGTLVRFWKSWFGFWRKQPPLQPFRTKWGLIAKNWDKSASSCRPAQPFRTKRGSIVKNSDKIAISGFPLQPFRTKWGSIAKNWGKIAISTCPAQPFRTK